MTRGYPDYEGGKSGVYLKPEWATVEGITKTIYGLAMNVAPGDYALVSYTIPTGKRLFITQASCAVKAYDVEDRDNLSNHKMDVVVDSDVYWTQGGQGGLGMVLTQPIRAEAGSLAKLFTFNYSNHYLNIWESLVGYEVDA